MKRHLVVFSGDFIMAKDIYKLSFTEFSALMKKFEENAKKHRLPNLDKGKHRKQFTSIKELDEYYQSTSAEESLLNFRNISS